MRQFILQSLAVVFLSYNVLHATETMAKTTGMRCNQCHKGRNPILGVMPKLKSKGMRHLIKLITVEGYVPKYNYNKLNYLAATIEANRKKVEALKKGKEQISTSAENPIADDKSVVNQKNKADNVTLKNKLSQSVADTRVKQKDIVVDGTSRSSSTADDIKIISTGQKKVSSGNQLSTINSRKSNKSSQKVVTNSEGKVKFKGGKTFILKRPKVKPGTKYDWEQDWSFDDYY